MAMELANEVQADQSLEVQTSVATKSRVEEDSQVARRDDQIITEV